MIATYRPSAERPRLGTGLVLVLGVLAVTEAWNVRGAENASTPGQAGAPPQIVSTSPKVGETNVDPNLKEITVTFDRDMAAGFSWTGSGAEHPTAPEGQKAHWRDKRTCVLPVKVESARYYRVGINSSSFRNFRSADGVPVDPSAIYFTTRGAGPELTAKVMKPQIVTMQPANGAQDVDPAITELRITFNLPMGSGFSWTGGGEQYPPPPEGKQATWIDGGKTCVLPVVLKPNHEYQLGVNSRSHRNFQSASGVPLDPVVYRFKTKNR